MENTYKKLSKHYKNMGKLIEATKRLELIGGIKSYNPLPFSSSAVSDMFRSQGLITPNNLAKAMSTHANNILPATSPEISKIMASIPFENVRMAMLYHNNIRKATQPISQTISRAVNLINLGLPVTDSINVLSGLQKQIGSTVKPVFPEDHFLGGISETEAYEYVREQVEVSEEKNIPYNVLTMRYIRFHLLPLFLILNTTAQTGDVNKDFIINFILSLLTVEWKPREDGKQKPE